MTFSPGPALRPSQFDGAHGLLDLNPPGRTQNKKFRPIIPVAETLMSWLRRDAGPSCRYVSYRGRPVRSILHMWRSPMSAALHCEAADGEGGVGEVIEKIGGTGRTRSAPGETGQTADLTDGHNV